MSAFGVDGFWTSVWVVEELIHGLANVPEVCA